ncbi:MAG TPA: nuclear transport factor 2 family protein [Chitinophagaceae bacterium]|nr:nuclear transport factor 2 family protein [Chitinophagaceae bacterium]
MNETKQIAIQWFDAFNKHDLEALLSLYAEDAKHYSPKLKIHQPETNGLIEGKEALRNWWRDAFTRLPELHYEVIRIMNEDDQIFMEYNRQVPGEDEMRVGELLMVQNGKIISSRVYHS